MFGSSSNNTASFFNKPSTSTSSSTTFGGTGTGGSIFGGGNNTNTTSFGGGLFGNNNTTNTGGSTFGGFNKTAGATSANGTATAPLFGGAAPNTSNSMTPATSGASIAAPSTGTSLFGSSANKPSTSASFFGTAANTTTSSTATPSLFGTATSTAGTATTASSQPFGGSGGGLFGSKNINSTPATSTSGTSTSLFNQPASGTSIFSSNNATQQQQQPQQQQESVKLLDLATCFPDTKAPHFIIQQNSIKRSTVPSSHWMERKADDRANMDNDNRNARNLTLFHTMDTTPMTSSTAQSSSATMSKAAIAPSKSQTLFRQLDGRTVVLPPFLTSTEQNLINPSKPSGATQFGMKRPLDDDSKMNGRNVLAKNQKGVFSSSAASDTLAAGFNINLKNIDAINAVPTDSIADVGVADARVKERMAMLAHEQKLQANAYHINEAENSYGMDIDSNVHLRPTTTATATSLSNNRNNNNNMKRRKRVRVLGFDTSNTEEVINYFKGLGALMEPPTSHGNWITFHYVDEESAQKAIKCHGMIIGRDRMIGVAWDENAKELEVSQLENAHTEQLFKRTPSSTANTKDTLPIHPISSSTASAQQQQQQSRSGTNLPNTSATQGNTNTWQNPNPSTSNNTTNAGSSKLKRGGSSISFLSTLKDKLLGW